MLIIGHRGSRGTKPENSLPSFREAYKVGADMLEFDIQLTSDKVPVVIHDTNLLRTHHENFQIASHTAAELAALKLKTAVPTLDQVLDEFYGKVLLNIELKAKGSSDATIELLKRKYIKTKEDWDNVLISSFVQRELIRTRKLAPHANLALLHSLNPFAYLALHRRLTLTAVGFHRLHANRFALEIAKRSGIFTYAYTVNRRDSAQKLIEKGCEGIVTDYPEKLQRSMDSAQKK